MSITKLDISLEDFEIGLSGAVPDRKDWSEPAMDRALLEFVALFSGIVFKYGGRIIHGCHPSFTPVILRQARRQASARLRKPVTLVMSDLWARNLREDDVRSMTDIAEFIVTRKVGDKGPEDAETRNQSLTSMRRVLVDAQNIMVAVGGKLHGADGFVPGVNQEMTFAARKGIPRFLIGGMGGYARELAATLAPRSLNNFLSDEQNVILFSTNDIGSCINVLFEHLAQSRELRQAALQPVKWNPDIRKVVDHRTGVVDDESSNNILRAVA
jgi:hypothetical protein